MSRKSENIQFRVDPETKLKLQYYGIQVSEFCRDMISNKLAELEAEFGPCIVSKRKNKLMKMMEECARELGVIKADETTKEEDSQELNKTITDATEFAVDAVPTILEGIRNISDPDDHPRFSSWVKQPERLPQYFFKLEKIIGSRRTVLEFLKHYKDSKLIPTTVEISDWVRQILSPQHLQTQRVNFI